MHRRNKMPLILLRTIWAKISGEPFRAAVWLMLVRIYAAGVLLLVVGAGYFAVHYLFGIVFLPPPMPAPMMDWAAHLDVGTLRSTSAEGVERPAPRAPVSHYHSVDQWFQPDAGNGCTLARCHEPLPHDHRA